MTHGQSPNSFGNMSGRCVSKNWFPSKHNVLFFFPESIAKGSSGKSFEHLHFDTYTYTHTLEERKHPSAKYASVKVCKCKYASVICKGKYASMICKGEYASTQ